MSRMFPFWFYSWNLSPKLTPDRVHGLHSHFLGLVVIVGVKAGRRVPFAEYLPPSKDPLVFPKETAVDEIHATQHPTKLGMRRFPHKCQQIIGSHCFKVVRTDSAHPKYVHRKSRLFQQRIQQKKAKARSRRRKPLVPLACHLPIFQRAHR